MLHKAGDFMALLRDVGLLAEAERCFTARKLRLRRVASRNDRKRLPPKPPNAPRLFHTAALVPLPRRIESSGGLE